MRLEVISSGGEYVVKVEHMKPFSIDCRELGSHS